MERLISDTAKMKDIQDELNVTVEEGDLSFGNIVNAISVMQKNLDITGTTAKEADATLQGSLSSMKAAWENFLSGSGGIEEVITTVETVARNVMRIAKEAITFIIKQVREALIKRGLGDLVDFVEKTIKKLPKIIEQIATTLKRLSPIILAVVTALVAYKATIIAINAINFISSIIGTVSAFISLIPSITGAKDAMLLFNMALNANPIGLVVAGVTALVTALTVLNTQAEEAKNATKDIAQGIADFYNGIKTAESYLDNFNNELFASAEEQQQLEEEMQNIQKGITDICKTASDERRGYTQEEITQLDEYFERLRELSKRELEIQNSVAGAITQQAKQNAETFEGTFEEYKTQSQKWIKTAQEQKDKTLQLIDKQTIEELALLEQRYGSEANMQNEAYKKEYERVMQQKQDNIDMATSQVTEVTNAFQSGFEKRINQNEEFNNKVKEYNTKLEVIEKERNKTKEMMDNDWIKSMAFFQGIANSQEWAYNESSKQAWEDLAKGMDEEQKAMLETWIASSAQTELYGGEISDESKKIATNVANNLDSMEEDSRTAMKNAMSPMLEEMEKSEPSLFAKAKGIADGILSNLKKAFDIHSPSRKTREIFRYLMEGAQLGLEDEESKLNRQVTKIGNNILEKMKNAVSLETGKINANATVRSNANYNSVIQVNANFEGNMTMDNTKVGRIVAPAVARTIKAGGLA